MNDLKMCMVMYVTSLYPQLIGFFYRTVVVLFTWGIWTRSFQGSIRINSSDVCPNTTLLLAKTNLTFAVCYCNICLWTHITIHLK